MSDLLAWTLVSVCGLLGFLIVSFLLRPRAQSKSAESEEKEAKGEVPPGGAEEPLLWYEVLKVEPSCTLDDLRAAYRSLLTQYHPDKVHSLGPEFRDLAEEKMKRINSAYAYGKNLKS